MPGGPRGPGRPAVWLLIAGLVLAAVNLRPAVTGLGPLLEEVRAGLGMNGTVAGLLTSVPSLCFAVFGAAAPRLARRFGPGAVLCAAMAALTLGLALRPFAGGTAAFLAATTCALAGIAVSNILMPVVVKHWFPGRVGAMTGLYSMAMAFGTAVAAAAAVPLTDALGGSWRRGLGAWAVVAAVAVAVWIPLARRRADGARQDAGSGTGGTGSRGAVSGARAPDGTGGTPATDPALRTGAAPEGTPEGAREPDGGGAAAPAPLRITRSTTAWALAVFFGLQASGAYITMGWMPQIFRDAGVPAGTAGLLLACIMAMGVPLSFLIPRLAARMRRQGGLVMATGVCGLAGYAGLWLAPAAGAPAWAVLLGISNSAFPLALTLVGMRARTGAGVTRLSAFAQSTGYLISIPGPLLVGVLYEHTGGWGVPIAMMAGLMVPQILVGLLAGRDRNVETESAAARPA